MYKFTFFFTSALVGDEWSALRLGSFTPGEIAPGTYWIGDWVGPGAGRDYMKILASTGTRTPTPRSSSP
jgi:hypothetical protein